MFKEDNFCPNFQEIFNRQGTNTKFFFVGLFICGDLVESRPGWDVVTRQSAFHQPLHPQAQAVQFVVDLQGGGAAGAARFARWVVVTGTGSRFTPRRWPPLVLGRPAVVVFPGVDGLEQTQVLFVAVQSEHVAGVVSPVVAPVVFVDLRGVLSVFQQRGHPLAVLVQVQEGEVKRQTPGRELTQTHRKRLETTEPAFLQTYGEDAER